jgi:hypothetical protein
VDVTDQHTQPIWHTHQLFKPTDKTPQTMSRKTLPKISVMPRVGDEYNIKPDQLFPRHQHPDERSVGEWRKACIMKSFEKRYGKLHDGSYIQAQNFAPQSYRNNNL